jgi:signal transduction histidine kinase
MAWWQRHWLPVVLAGMLGCGVVGVVNLASEIGQPFGGFFTVHHFTTDDWSMDSATPHWWPVVAQVGLRDLDYLQTIDGVAVGPNQRKVYASAWQQGKQRVPLVVERDGQPLTQIVDLVLFSLPDFLDIKLPDFVTGLGFWLLAVVIYRARPTETLNRVFALTAICIAGYLWLPHVELFLYSGPVSAVVTLVWGVTVTLLGAFILHCAFLYPTPLRHGWRLLPAMYVVYGGMAVLYAIVLIWRWSPYWAPPLFDLDFLGFRFATYSLMGSALILLTRLVWSAWHERSVPRVRGQLLIILGGLCVAFLPMSTNFVGALSRQSNYFVSGLDVRYLMLALPLAFAYVIMRYQTFRSTPPPLFIAVVVLITGALIASAGDWLVRSLFPALPHSMFAPMLIVALLAGGLWSGQGVFQRTLARFFKWEETSYRAVKRFAERVAAERTLEQLPQTIVQALVTEMKIEQAAVWLWDDAEGASRLRARAGAEHIPLPGRLSCHLDELTSLMRPVRLTATSPRWLAPLRGASLEAVAALTGPDGPIGLLGLGKRGDEEVFHDRDLEIVELIAQQSALFLLTAWQIEELRQVPRRVSDAQERERFKIAQELHDTIQQFLGRLPFYLEVSRSAAHDDPARADALLQRCIDDVEQAAKTVRHIRANLAPFQLQNGLVGPLQDFVQRFGVRHGLQTHVSATPELDEALSGEARHALYRVIQQALDNTVGHAQASQITVTLQQIDRQVTFEVRDDGLGSSLMERAQAEAQGSFGLKSMRDRIESLGGEFEFMSTPGSGTIVRGWVPTTPIGS